jgi:hemolysin III
MTILGKPYKLEEEIANAITHGLGAALAIAGLAILVARATILAPAGLHGTYIAAFGVFGASMVFLYLVSALYHSLLTTRACMVFERLDHSAIYVLIAGTYTAFCLTALHGPLGWGMLTLIWALAVAGIALYAIFGRKLRVVSVITYILMGWIIVLAMNPLKAAISEKSWMLLLAGGVVYTAGAFVYLLKNVRWTHPVWHLFVMGGTTLHFFAVLYSF